MDNLSGADKALIIKLYYQSNESVTAALRQFCTQKNIHKKEQCPSNESLARMIKRFEETGSCDKRNPPGKPAGDSVQLVQAHIDTSECGSISCRKSSSKVGISKSQMHRIMRYNLNLFPFKPVMEHFVPETAQIERIEFCQKFLENVAENEDFLDNILFSDESLFELENIQVNKQNKRFWCLKGSQPLETAVTVKQFPKKLMVWFGFTSKFCIGPYFFYENVNATNYQDMLHTFVIPELKKKHKFSSTVFMQDGATPHTAKTVKEYLLSTFGNRVISRGHEFGWPGYSPDLNPLDFAFWGFIKDLVGQHHYSTMDELKEAIIEEFAKMSTSFYQNSVYSLINRCYLCLEVNGGTF
jgi:hypothetical protein